MHNWRCSVLQTWGDVLIRVSHIKKIEKFVDNMYGTSQFFFNIGYITISFQL